jgi:hypothetical protein
MKRINLTGCLLFLVVAVYGQITLNKTYDFSTSVVKLETAGYKYYLMDVPNSQCRIYNMDHSIFKTINCPVPAGFYLSDIKFISENLFNTDSKIELTYTYYQYVPTATSYYYVYGSRIADENGNTLLTIDGALYNYVIKTSDTQYKLFAYCYDYSVSPEKIWTNIYNLPGTLVSALSLSGKQADLFTNAYPNPASEQINLDYVLPSGVNTADLKLVNIQGQVVKNYRIDGHTDHLAITVNDLSEGVYNYYIEYNNSRTEAKKIIIQ